jgi:hypothetical protein
MFLKKLGSVQDRVLAGEFSTDKTLYFSLLFLQHLTPL